MHTGREYQIRRTSRKTAEVLNDIEIGTGEDDRGTFRKVVRAHLLENEAQPRAAVSITLRHQRRHKITEEWQSPDAFSAARLRAGEEVQFRLGHRETFQLFNELSQLYQTCVCGIPEQSGTYTLINTLTGEVIEGKALEVVKLLTEHDPEFLRKVVELDPNILQNLKLMDPGKVDAFVENEILESRRKSVATFREHMAEHEWGEEWDESVWAEFFEENKWIFGYGLSYRFLNLVQTQPHYGGAAVDGKGNQRGDYMAVTRGNARFTVLVEIKRPTTTLVLSQYRARAHHISKDLGGAVAQVQSDCDRWASESQKAENVRKLESKGIYTYQPKGIVVIGDTQEFAQVQDEQERTNRISTFELFRRNLVNPEVITFDELLARAEYIVGEGKD